MKITIRHEFTTHRLGLTLDITNTLGVAQPNDKRYCVK